MTKKVQTSLVVVLIVVVVAVVAAMMLRTAPAPSANVNSVGNANANANANTNVNSNVNEPPPSAETVSDGTVTFTKPDDFGLAVKPEQVLVTAYIPPCEEGFGYCLYFNAGTYAGTNFESAGLSIRKRADLTTQAACLTTQPEGYTGLVPKSATHADYAISAFSPIGDAGAGHYAAGDEYRLFTDGTCEQFTARIGETQFANYPEGTIRLFTDADRSTVHAKLTSIIEGMTLKGGTTVALP